MSIVILGVSYKTAPLGLRERLAFPGDRLTEGLRLLSSTYAREAAILSTCHRSEVYAVVSESQELALSDFLVQSRDVPQEELSAAMYRYRDAEAVRHLYRVAAGLESAVLGEPEVLGQVRHALEKSRAVGACGPVLGRLLLGAIAAGKRVRTETEIARDPLSLATIAVRVAEQAMGALQGRQVLVVGAGKMGSKALKYLLAIGSRVTVVDRNPRRARARGEFAPAEVVGFDALESMLPTVDLVLSSTAAPHPVISAEAVRRAMAKRRGRPLTFIDLALPRDVDPEVRNITQVHIIDVDELSRIVESNWQRRWKEVPKVEAIIKEEIEAFLAWYYSRQVTPTISRLRSHARAIQEREVARALRRLGRLSPREIKVVKEMAGSIVNKILHNPTVRLKQESSRGNGLIYAEALHTLFGLDEEGTSDE